MIIAALLADIEPLQVSALYLHNLYLHLQSEPPGGYYPHLQWRELRVREISWCVLWQTDKEMSEQEREALTLHAAGAQGLFVSLFSLGVGSLQGAGA